METSRLRYFCTIAEAGSLTAAAQILNVSHSGLSKAMSVLQAELNLQLFRPLGRGLELTEAGRQVYTKAKLVIEGLEQLSQPQHPALSQNTIRIGMAEVFALGCAGPLAKLLNENKMTADFYELDSGESEVQLLADKIDFAIGFVPFPHPELEHLKIKKVSMGVFCKQSKFLKIPFHEIPFVVPNHEIKNNPLSLKSRDGWPANVERNIQFGASSLALAQQLVNEGLAAVFMPRFLGHRLNYIEIEVKKSSLQQSERDLFIIKKKNIDETKAMKIAAKVIRNSVLD